MLKENDKLLLFQSNYFKVSKAETKSLIRNLEWSVLKIVVKDTDQATKGINHKDQTHNTNKKEL